MTPTGAPLPLGRCWAPVTLETFIEAQLMDMEDELERMEQDDRGWK